MNGGSGYTAEYEYDLVGNRLSRAVWFDHRADELYTEYEHNDKDQLIRETHSDTIPSARLDHPDGPYYAYAGTNGGVFYTKANSKVKIGQFKAWLLGLPSSVSHWLFGLVMVMLVVAFFVPALVQILARIRGRQPTRMPLSLSHRCLSVLIAYVMLISPAGFEQLVNASVQYSQLGVSTWGQADRIIEYGWWDGTGRTGNFTLGYDDNGSATKKITWDTNGTPGTGSDDTKIEEVTYQYNLQNRLCCVTTVNYLSSTTTVVEYKYNDEGIRVQKIEDPDGSPIVTTYLADTYNHTGYAQTLEENTGGTLKTYTIGDDVLSQAEDSDPAEHLLYDGQGSTRQLVSGSVGSTNIIDDFSYDGYGVLLQDESSAQSNPGKTPSQATSLLYTGEHFDTDAQQYYLRARWYNPLSGMFNRVDPYSGSTEDPQSLHKYLYCHANPINATDPSGLTMVSLVINIAMYASLMMAIIPNAIRAFCAAKEMLKLTDFTNFIRRLANRGVIDFFVAESIRAEAFYTFAELLGTIGESLIMIANAIVEYYAYNMAFAAITQVAMGGIATSVRLSRASKVAVELGDDIIHEHHLVFKSAVKRKYLKVNLFKLSPELHHSSSPTGLHARIAASRFARLQPGGSIRMKDILKMGKQKWLDELGECYKWLETEWSSDYKGIYDAYQKAVEVIGGARGLIKIRYTTGRTQWNIY